jgi:hypothetical protein
MAVVLWASNQLCYFVCFFTLFVTYFVHNVSATISYAQKELLGIRTAIASSNWTNMFSLMSQTQRFTAARGPGPNLKISCRPHYPPREF